MADAIPEFVLRSMLGDALTDAVLAARKRTGDASVMASCAEGRWTVSRRGEAVASGLTHDAALEAMGTLA